MIFWREKSAFKKKIFTSHNLDLNSHLVNRASRTKTITRRDGKTLRGPAPWSLPCLPPLVGASVPIPKRFTLMGAFDLALAKESAQTRPRFPRELLRCLQWNCKNHFIRYFEIEWIEQLYFPRFPLEKGLFFVCKWWSIGGEAAPVWGGRENDSESSWPDPCGTCK